MADMAATGDIGVFQGVEVDGFAVGVVGPLFAPGDGTAVEGRSVVGFDGAEVAASVVTHQAHPADRVFHPVEFAEDLRHLFGDIFVDDHLPGMIFAVEATISQPQIAQIPEGNGAAVFVGMALAHTLFGLFVDGVD